ncbi:hypothetical protein WJX74_002460 [Apatococcus lobatus]|uniref:Uncharacterized protein n=1 Tax=Apatococcus lobatus TaxID=904363 RepID=A0AAW1QWS0_9CHLO
MQRKWSALAFISFNPCDPPMAACWTVQACICSQQMASGDQPKIAEEDEEAAFIDLDELGGMMAQGAGTEGFITQDDTEAVLKKVMDDGSFDKMRHKVIDQIKQNKDIVSRSEQLVRSSKALSAPGAGARTKKDLFDAIRRELEEEVLNEAVKAAWEILTTSTRCGGDPASAMTLRSAGESWVSPETSEQDTSPLHPTTSS